MITTKTERDLLIKAMVAIRIAGIKLAEVFLGDGNNAGGAEFFLDNVQGNELMITFNCDSVNEIKAVVVIIDGRMSIGGFTIFV